jgi:hypothetical protein
MRGLFFSASIVFVLLCPIAAPAVTPLNFHTRAVVEIEARVERISYAETSEVNTNEWMLRKSEAESRHPAQVQKILLKVIKVIHLEKRTSRAPGLAVGHPVEITNPFPDQQPPFKEGDFIRTSIRLVALAEPSGVPGRGEQWWFSPPGEPEGINAPRRPFKGIILLPSPR